MWMGGRRGSSGAAPLACAPGATTEPDEFDPDADAAEAGAAAAAGADKGVCAGGGGAKATAEGLGSSIIIIIGPVALLDAPLVLPLCPCAPTVSPDEPAAASSSAPDTSIEAPHEAHHFSCCGPLALALALAPLVLPGSRTDGAAEGPVACSLAGASVAVDVEDDAGLSAAACAGATPLAGPADPAPDPDADAGACAAEASASSGVIDGPGAIAGGSGRRWEDKRQRLGLLSLADAMLCEMQTDFGDHVSRLMLRDRDSPRRATRDFVKSDRNLSNLNTDNSTAEGSMQVTAGCI